MRINMEAMWKARKFGADSRFIRILAPFITRNITSCLKMEKYDHNL